MGDVTTIAGRRRLGVAAAAKQKISSLDPWIGLWPILYFLLIEYARPMAWFPFIKPFRPGMIATLWGLTAVLMARQRRRLPAPTIWLLAFCALMIYQIPAAMDHKVAMEKFQDAILKLTLGLLLPLSVLPNSVRAMRILATGFFAIHIPTAVWGLNHDGLGPGGWLGDENDLAFALNAAIGLGVFLFVESRDGRRKFWLLGGIVLMVTTVIVSFSRGGLLGLSSVALYVFITAKRARKPILVMLLIGVIAVLAFASSEWKAEMGTISEAGSPQDTGGKRLYYWGIGWRMFLDHPVFGVGTENFGKRAPEYRDQSRYKESMWRRVAHSLYFTLLPEHGLVGAFIYGMMIWTCFRGHRRIQRRHGSQPDDPDYRSAALISSGMCAALVATLITGTFVSVLYYPSVWVLCCMIGSLIDVADNEAKAKTEQPAEASG